MNELDKSEWIWQHLWNSWALIIIVHYIWALLSYSFQSFGYLGLVRCGSFIVAILFDGIQFKYVSSIPVAEYISAQSKIISKCRFLFTIFRKTGCLNFELCFYDMPLKEVSALTMYLMNVRLRGKKWRKNLLLRSGK